MTESSTRNNQINDLVFSLDPGSKKTGWSVMNRSERLIQAGLLLPDKQTAASEFRIGVMCSGLWTLLNYWQPKTILIEWTSGKVGKNRHGGQGAGLAVYGIAVGSLWREVLAWLRYQPPENQLVTNVVLVKENTWTRQVPKADRIAAVAAVYPEYDAGNDSGGDIADAIGLAVWYLREQAVRLAECLK